MQRIKGFTLVEIMIVIAIIGILSAAGITSLSSGKERKVVEGEARRLAATIREVQNYALTGKQIGGQVPCKFGVQALTSGDSQMFFAESHRTGASCSVGASVPAAIPSMTINLANGVTVANDLNFDFFFTVPRGELDPNGNTTPINIQLHKGSATYSVCVYPGGQVKDVQGTTCP